MENEASALGVKMESEVVHWGLRWKTRECTGG